MSSRLPRGYASRPCNSHQIHQAVHRDPGSVVECASRDVASVAGQIVNAKRDRDTLRITPQMGIYRYRLPAPSLALTSVVPDELLLFCIDANYRKTRFEKLRLLSGDVSELRVAV